MTISRRKFLRAGTVAALAAGIPLKSALVAAGQGNRKERDANPGNGSFVDPLSYYTKAAFAAYLNSTFLLKAGSTGTVAVTLNEIRDIGSGTGAAGQESFSLRFKNSDGPALPQGTYEVEHAALGSFALFLVPGGMDQDGEHSFVAVINRLGNGPALFSAPVNAKTLTAAKSDGKTTSVEKTAPVAPGLAPKKAKRSWKSGEVEQLCEGIVMNQ